jgi:hypothetical protein
MIPVPFFLGTLSCLQMDGQKCWPSVAFLAPKLTRQFGTPNASVQMWGREARETPLPALFDAL